MANIEEQSAVVHFDDDADLNDSDFNDSDNDVYDDDDILFDHNVTKGIELDMPLTIEDGQAPESDSSSHVSSEELNIRSDSESDENSSRQKFPEYYVENENGKKKNPHLEVGLLFSSFEELKSVLKDYAVFNGVEPILKRNDKDRVHCVCKDGCTWRLWASKLQGEKTVQIKTYVPKHTCFRVRTNKNATFKWLVEYYLDDFRADPEWKIKHFRSTVRNDFGLHITKVVSWNTRKYAKVLVEGSDEEQFALLHCYGAELRRTNPGSTVIVSQPIAYAVIQKENTSSWRWFLMLLSEDLSMENWSSVTLMSDRQKGLRNVVADLFPTAEHRFCVRHMYQIFFRKDFKGKHLKDCL
ncbi:uncharacterized protein LOC111382388 [Olea europaea var. sylvestris]|uniref:uncharacterized protein LOC111382388 n=1 Tax=Olea europaea var. sylvestris TaxID=158386 RepID=UPI000C1D1D4C|nr:uncharacterized protein LOC111382388 [Olea europaea var. sylvestris]